MKILSPVLAMVIFPAIAFTQATGVDGWNGAKWGMTLAQVKASITYNLERDPRFVSTKSPTLYRTAEPFNVLGVPVRAYFLFSANENKLVCVEVEVDSHSLNTVHSPSESFERFRQSLVETFGQPTFTDDGGRMVFWKFASSSITLQQAAIGNEPFVGVTYKQTSK